MATKTTKAINPVMKLCTAIAMKRFSNKEKVAIVLAIIIAMAIVNQLFINWTLKLKKQNIIIESLIPPPTAATNVAPVLRAGVEQLEPLSGQKEYFTIRDPFLASKNPEKQQPAGAQQKSTIDLKVSGILWDEKVPTAIINSKVLKIGDSIYGKTIVDMERDKVILMEEGELFVLKLRKE
jgi:hypothetical protein